MGASNKSTEFKDLRVGDDVEVVDPYSKQTFQGTVAGLHSSQFTYTLDGSKKGWKFCMASGDWKRLGTRTFNKYKCRMSDCGQEFATSPGPTLCPNCGGDYVKWKSRVTLSPQGKVISEQEL